MAKYRDENGKLTDKYVAWYGMIARCHHKSNSIFKYYGGRDIKVCDKWKTYEGFWEDMGKGYKKGLTLERIDNDGNYELNNCRWATRTEQARNRRSTPLWEWKGMKKCWAEWAEHLGVKSSMLRSRYYMLNWSVEKTLSTPVKKKGGY